MYDRVKPSPDKSVTNCRKPCGGKVFEQRALTLSGPFDTHPAHKYFIVLTLIIEK